MHEQVEATIEALGNKVRCALLRELAVEPHTAVELAERLEVSHTMVHRHLVKLEQLGLVTADVPPGGRRGSNTVTWSTDTQKLVRRISGWMAYLTADDRYYSLDKFFT